MVTHSATQPVAKTETDDRLTQAIPPCFEEAPPAAGHLLLLSGVLWGQRLLS